MQVQVTMPGTGPKRSRGVRRPPRSTKSTHSGQAKASARKRKNRTPTATTEPSLE